MGRMADNSVALSMIAGDGWEKEKVQRLLESIEPHIAAIYVNYNGTKSRVPYWQRWTDIPVHWMRSEWQDNFGLTRQESYLAIPKNTYDWWTWLDTDDTLVAPDGLGDVFKHVHEYHKGIFIRYAYGVDPATGVEVVNQERERIFNMDWKWSWRYRIHETVNAPLGTPFLHYSSIPITDSTVYVKHHKEGSLSENAVTRKRNRKIVILEWKENPDDPRNILNMARETLADAFQAPEGPEKLALCDAAIREFTRYINKTAPLGPNDEAYLAGCRIGDLFVWKQDFSAAIDAYMQAARHYPHWVQAWVGAAKACMVMGDFGRMEGFASLAVGLERPASTTAIETMDYGYHPLMLRGVAREELGKFKEAIVDYRAALKIYADPDDKLEQRIKIVRKQMRAQSRGTGTKHEKMLLRRGSCPDKSISFFTNPIPETWNQKTLRESGHGGAETLVLELAPRFAADGWRVSVFGCPGDEMGIGDDGVEYWKSEDWIPTEKRTVFISSRAGTPFTGPLEAKASFLWMHDVNVGPGLREVAGVPNKIVPISKWHSMHMTDLYGIPQSSLHVVPNGVDLSMYPASDFSDGHNFVWSSSPDRGLDTLLGLWPHIRELWPDATLSVFYGWEFIDKITALHGKENPLAIFKGRVRAQWKNLGGEDSGLYWYGRVPPQELAEHQLKGDIWAYPTDFMETYCLTAIQAQASGMIPITSKLAALTENIAIKELLVSGWPGNSSYQREFLERLEEVLDGSPEDRHTARTMGRAFAERHTIDDSYRAWNDLFIKEGIKV